MANRADQLSTDLRFALGRRAAAGSLGARSAVQTARGARRGSELLHALRLSAVRLRCTTLRCRAVRQCGCTAVRLYDCTAVRLYGCTAVLLVVRLYGCTVVRLYCWSAVLLAGRHAPRATCPQCGCTDHGRRRHARSAERRDTCRRAQSRPQSHRSAAAAPPIAPSSRCHRVTVSPCHRTTVSPVTARHAVAAVAAKVKRSARIGEQDDREGDTADGADEDKDRRQRRG